MRRAVGDLSEAELLERILERVPAASEGVLVGVGDDAAVLAGGPDLVVTTDTMVLGQDWLDAWSSPWEVGAKLVTQNLGDVAAMGARCTAMVLTLTVDPELDVVWVEELARGVGDRAREGGFSIAGGDLSSAPVGVRMVSVTALGALTGPPVLRSGARPGDVVAVSGHLGRAATGLELLQEGVLEAPVGVRESAECLAHQRAPEIDAEAGPLAAAAGATAMLDLSDGLGRDGGRLATASDVVLELQREELADDLAFCAAAVGVERADRAVLTGGEEHTLLATFPDESRVPGGWRVIGRCRERAAEEPPGVLVDGQPVSGGWDHFRAG
ncbi:thiamine-monophosphate kinase [Kytococcus aerolatus]|uniref:Thiamine-monophosphate kinase n=1 Tax=Kytococcus aerolatus TaxID=592308 RepID=A0A212U1J8_9MICO|nr:thiamine-phosphate kinase [Kytococcus aerolatus]SNC72122.1 thiamine-monophosphate kinase [Kytococcus aerolatus]